MKYPTLGLVSILMLIAGLQLLTRKPSTPATQKIAPASVSKIDGTDVKRLTLLPEAARRLDIQTALIREEPFVPTRKVAGEIVSIKGDTKAAVVQVNLIETEMKRVNRAVPAFILPLARDSKAAPIQALPISTPAGLDGPPGSIFYEVTASNHGLQRHQLVFIELPIGGNPEKRKIIPYAAVLYDPHGNTWAYAAPEPLVFVRQPITIETIHGNNVLLSAGPPAGTAVVTVGGAELYGTEFGVGK